MTQRVVEEPRIRERRDALSHDWTPRLAKWGVLPLLVPNTWPQPEQLLEAWGAQALLLTGGNSPTVAALPPGLTRSASIERDTTERRLIAWANERGIPTLGVARGAQMLNLYFGGRVTPVPRGGTHAGVFHPIVSVAGSGEPPLIQLPWTTVNSFHDLAIESDGLAPALRAFAAAPDGTVEGFVHPSRPILGVVWHPERAGPRCAPLEALLAGLLRGHAPWLEPSSTGTPIAR